MLRHLVIAGLIAALFASAAPAFAFQETPVPPPDPATPAPQAKPRRSSSARQASAPIRRPTVAASRCSATRILPKLDFGLELLYGGDDKQLQIQQGPSFDENQDVTVLGKVKRHF